MTLDEFFFYKKIANKLLLKEARRERKLAKSYNKEELMLRTRRGFINKSPKFYVGQSSIVGPSLLFQHNSFQLLIENM